MLTTAALMLAFTIGWSVVAQAAAGSSPSGSPTSSPKPSGAFRVTVPNVGGALWHFGLIPCTTATAEATFVAGGGRVANATWTIKGPGFLSGSQPSFSVAITATAPGTITVTASAGGFTASARVGVIEDPEPLGPPPVCAPAPSPTPAACDIKGVIRDGNLASDGHANPLVGIPVELLRDGSPIGEPFVTDADGAYCLPGGRASPGDYQLRASLADGEHNPPVFKTVDGSDTDPASVTKDISADDFGRQDLDFDFSATADQPRLADDANIHWQSERFMTWLLDTVVLDPARLAGLVIDTDASGGTRYAPDTRTVFIDATNTPFSERQDAASECPENCEWHEISHHVATVMSIAPTATAPACANRTNHGGWLNNSTCDSLAEGFAMFLPTLASLDIDAGRGAGYADASYSVFGSLEDNGYRPWSLEGTQHREDFAVSELLWDLADDTPNERLYLAYKEPGFTGFAKHVETGDAVAIGGVRLVQLLFLAKPQTVADIYDALRGDPAVPAEPKAVSIDLDGDGTADISPLDAVFIAHGFHRTTVGGDDSYYLGSPIGETQPGANNVSERRHIEPIPGSAIRFQNPSASAVTFSIDVTYPSTTSHLEVKIPAGSERVVHLEVPPYWSGGLQAGQALPPCAPPDPWPITIAISAPGAVTRTISSCGFLQAVAATTTDAVVIYDVSGGGAAPTPIGTAPATTSAEVPTGLLVGVVLAAAAVVTAGVAFWSRRRHQ